MADLSPVSAPQILRDMAAEAQGVAIAAGELAAIHERGASSSLRPDDKPRHERLREIQLARRTQAESRRDALLAGALALETQEGPAA